MSMNDEPIDRPENDRLGRYSIAQGLAECIRSLDTSVGNVVGIMGPWGAGKTSFIHLVQHALSSDPAYPVLSYNPWLFSGTDELVQSFFLELSEQLRIDSGRFNRIADELERYGDAIAPLKVLPVIGGWIDRASSSAQSLKKLRGKGQGGSSALRMRIESSLRQLDIPILVILDDIDRLTSSEIQDIFRLVRLTASFPNVVYIMAFDRTRVELALSEDGLPGREYMEKIVQISFDIPLVPAVSLHSLLREAIYESLSEGGTIDASPFDTKRWQDVSVEVIDPLIRQMRDVKRYALSIRSTVQNVEGHIELVDVLAMEAIRVFLPDVFLLISMNPECITRGHNWSMYPNQAEDELAKAVVQSILAAAGGQAAVVEALLHRVFPNGARHIRNSYGGEAEDSLLKEARLGNIYILQYYLDRTIGPSLQAHWSARSLLPLLADPPAFNSYMDRIDPADWAAAVSALEPFEADFTDEFIAPGVASLLNLVGRMPRRERAVFDFFDEETIVSRIVWRLLKRLPDKQTADQIVNSILPNIERVSDRFTLVTMVGYIDGAGHEIVSEVAAQRFERALKSDIQATTTDVLATERLLVRILYWAATAFGDTEAAIVVPSSGNLPCAILRASLSNVRRQSIGSRSVEIEVQLNWEALEVLFGGESGIADAVKNVGLDTADKDLSQAVELAEKYLTGWRPPRFRA